MWKGIVCGTFKCQSTNGDAKIRLPGMCVFKAYYPFSGLWYTSATLLFQSSSKPLSHVLNDLSPRYSSKLSSISLHCDNVNIYNKS